MTEPVLRFTLGDQYYGFPIRDVVEVAAMVESAELGIEAHPAIYGVVIRRGEPLILVDLRVVFRVEANPIDLSTLFIVVRYGEELVGFIVDTVEGVVYLAPDKVHSLDGGNGYVSGVATYNNTLIQWLSVTPMLSDILPESVETVE